MSQRIEPGIYLGRAIAGSEQYGSTSNGNDQIVININLLDLGETVSTFLVFSDKAAPWSMKRLRALGWTGSDLTNLEGIDSQDVDVEVKYEEYQGEMKMKVQIVAGGTVTLENQFDDKGKKAFAAKFASLAKSTTPAKAAKPASRSDATPSSADDIPF